MVPFTTEMRKEVRRVTRRLNQDGLRALAVAYKWLPPEDRTYSVDDEKELVLSGYVAFLDPPKETAREASPHFGSMALPSRSLLATTKSSPAKSVRKWGCRLSTQCWVRT